MIERSVLESLSGRFPVSEMVRHTGTGKVGVVMGFFPILGDSELWVSVLVEDDECVGELGLHLHHWNPEVTMLEEGS